MKQILFFLKSWGLIISASCIARILSLFRYSTPKDQLCHPFVLAIATSTHHFALAIMWAQAFVGIHRYSCYVFFSGRLYLIKPAVFSPGKTSVQVFPLSIGIGKSIYLSVYSFITAEARAPLYVELPRLLSLFSQNTLLLPHVTPWIFPSFADLLIASYCRMLGNIAFIDDGTTAYLSSSLPHRFAGCPAKNEIYSLNLSCLGGSLSNSSAPSVPGYFGALSVIESTLTMSNESSPLPEGRFDFIISSKYLSLDLVASCRKSLVADLQDLSVCYIPHPRAWKNDYVSVLSYFPSVFFARPEVLELFLLENTHKISRIFIGYSSAAFLLAEMKCLGLFDGQLILAMSSCKQNQYGGRKEFHDFLATCRLTSQFARVLHC
jgi:hypothetical protein